MIQFWQSNQEAFCKYYKVAINWYWKLISQEIFTVYNSLFVSLALKTLTNFIYFPAEKIIHKKHIIYIYNIKLQKG